MLADERGRAGINRNDPRLLWSSDQVVLVGDTNELGPTTDT